MVKVPTLGSVNEKLLKELDRKLDECESIEGLAALSDAISKLNASYRNNDQFPAPETKEERAERELQAALRGAMNGDD